MGACGICRWGFHNGKWDGGGNGLGRWTNLVNFYPTFGMMRIPLLGLLFVMKVSNNNAIILDQYSGGSRGIGWCSRERTNKGL